MAEERFTSQYDGTTQDNLLKFAENVKKATTVDGAETVNVQGFTLPRISDISGFVAVNNAGNAIGFMSKDQVASVLGGLIGINDTWLREKGAVTTACSACVQNGTYSINRTTYPSVGDVPPSLMYGILVVFRAGFWVCQLAADIIMKTMYYRVSGDNATGFSEWKQI